MTRRERKENKIEQRREWAEKRAKKADQEYKTGKALGETIPLGQPILIGHHSEKSHRNAIKKLHGYADRALENDKMKEHHLSTAARIQTQLDTTIFSDDPDAIEQLQKKLARLEALRSRIKEINKAIKDKVDIELTEAEKKELDSLQKVWGSRSFPAYTLTNLGGRIRDIKKRIESLATKKKRYVTLAGVAEDGKLNHGKTWVCKDKDILTHDLPVQWIGKLICYVY